MNDTPLKRFTAFWVVLGAFLLFGIIALILAPLANTSEVTAADEAGAERRLAIREAVDAEQAKNLSRSENGDKLQVPPAEVFSLVGSQLAGTKPTTMKNDLYRDPAAGVAEEQEAPAEEAPAEAAAPTQAPEPAQESKPAETEVAPAAEENPALTPQAPSPETASEPADPSAL